jgi:hypothetical protein
MMRCFFSVSLMLFAVPAVAQDNEAERLYRAMEKKLTAAKTLEIELHGEVPAGDKAATQMDFRGKGGWRGCAYH